MNHDYTNTFITVAPDTRATAAKVPQPRGEVPTVAVLQYEMLSDPFAHTQADVLFEVWLRRMLALEPDELAHDERDRLREEFFAKGQPCLRASPLTKTHGWGVVFDEGGRAALVPMESEDYTAYATADHLDIIPAMRSKRA